MDILENPFWLISASTQVRRQRLAQLAEEASLLHDDLNAAPLLNELTHPRRRLALEVAWLPGLTNWECERFLEPLKNGADLPPLDEIPPLAAANLMAAVISRQSFDSVYNMSAGLIKLANLFDQIDIDRTLALINRDRAMAEMPPVTDIEAVYDEIRQRRHYFRNIINEAVAKLAPIQRQEAATTLAIMGTEDGAHPAPMLINDYIEDHLVSQSAFFEETLAEMDKLTHKAYLHLKRNGNGHINLKVSRRILEILNLWKQKSAPADIVYQVRGREHKISEEMADRLLKFSAGICNEYNNLHEASRINGLLIKHFPNSEAAEVGESNQQIFENITWRNRMSPVFNRLNQLRNKIFTKSWGWAPGAGRQAAKLLKKAPTYIQRLEFTKSLANEVAMEKNQLAYILLICAIRLANSKRKWDEALKLMETAEQYAVYPRVRQNIEANKKRAANKEPLWYEYEHEERNEEYVDGRWRGWCGFGYSLFGYRPYTPDMKPYITTVCLTLFFFLHFPVARLVVGPKKRRQMVLGREPLPWYLNLKQQMIFAVTMLLVYFIFWLFNLLPI